MKFNEQYIQISTVIAITVFSFDDWSNDAVEPLAAANVCRECCRPVATRNTNVTFNGALYRIVS